VQDCPGKRKAAQTEMQMSVYRPSSSWPGLSRPSTRRRCKQLLRLAAASGRGCPAQGHGCPVRFVEDIGAPNSLPPCGGGPGRGVARTSQKMGLCEDSERSARPPSLTLPHKGGGNSSVPFVPRIHIPRDADRLNPQRSVGSPSCVDFLNRTVVAQGRA
jgi:hypothetical protein